MPVYIIHAKTSWAESRLVFEDSSGADTKEVHIMIDRPGDVAYIREKLNEIEASWRRQLDGIKVSS